MSDAEWAALPVEIRMWAIEMALAHLPEHTGTIDEQARLVAAVLVKAPAIEDEHVEPQTRDFRQERGLQ